MSMLVSFSVSEDGERVSMKKRFLKSDAYRQVLKHFFHISHTKNDN